MPGPVARFAWNELMTTDTAGAAAFYGAVAGWGTRPWEAEPGYAAFTGARGSVAGLMPLPAEARAAGATPSWMPYARVPDVDAAVGRALALGGRVVRGAADAPGVGRWALLADAQGAAFGVWGAPFTQGETGEPARGDISRHELLAPDPAAAVRFYEDLLGWREVLAMPSAGATARWLCCIRVDEVVAAVVRVISAGGSLDAGPTAEPGGHVVARATDPQGALFGLHQPPIP